MPRSLRLVVAAVAVAGLAPFSAAHADPEPPGSFYWEHEPSVTVNPDARTITVDPGRPAYAC